MKLSIIIPTFNENDHLERLIDSIGKSDPIEKEIIFTDGGSLDGTWESILKFGTIYPYVKGVQNPDKYVSQGFNRAYRQAEGQFIALVGAHAIYPPGYFSTCVTTIESGVCDVAGGFLVHVGRSKMGKAIALAMASRFGVGDTPFRTSRKRQYVDSVAFAVYPRRIFESVGLFDEDMVRNQDDEFHYRVHAAGHRILLLPELEVQYFVREHLPALWTQYFQYGFYKPLVFKKVKSGIRMRHLVPPAFSL
jgi:glycosyltransferase involved in cell wall biosynthesis